MRSDDQRNGGTDTERRRALRLMFGGVLGALGLGACGAGKTMRPPPVEVALAEIPENGRLRVVHGENPVELIRSRDGVAARSLWCTHWGCEVAWSEEEKRYLCPCHAGVFDENGRVVSGPPPAALASYPIEVRDETVRIGVTREPEATG